MILAAKQLMFGRSTRFQNSYLAAISIVSLIVLVLLHQAYVSATHPDAVYMDSLRLLHQLEEWKAGRLTTHELWGQGSAHRGLVNQVFLLANVEWFSLNPLLANRSTGLFLCGVATLLLGAFYKNWSEGTSPPSAFAALVAVLIPLLIFSWAGFELLTLDLGSPLWFKNFLIVGYFCAHAAYLRNASTDRSSPATLAFPLVLVGPCIVVFVSMGWSYAFIGAVLGVHILLILHGGSLNRQTLRGWAPTLSLLGGFVVYLAEGRAGADDGSLSVLVRQIPRALALAPNALGSAWMGLETATSWRIPLVTLWSFGVISILMASMGLWSRWRRGLMSGSLLPLYLLGYASLTALSVAVARGEAGPPAVMASRYYMDLVLFQIGALWLFAEQAAQAWSRDRRLPGYGFVLVCVLVAGAQLLTYVREWHVAPYRKSAFVAMNRAIQSGVPDEDAASLLQSPIQHARLGAAVMRRRALGPFASMPPSNDCDAQSIEFLSGWHAPEDGGVWMSGRARLTIPACPCALVAGIYVPAEFGDRELHMKDPSAPLEKRLRLRAGDTLRVQLPGASARREIGLATDSYVVPARDLKGSADVRELGAYWTDASFVCANREIEAAKADSH